MRPKYTSFYGSRVLPDRRSRRVSIPMPPTKPPVIQEMMREETQERVYTVKRPAILVNLDTQRAIHTGSQN